MECAPRDGAARLSVVTGAFGYTGRYITRRLLDEGQRVRTLTGHPDRRSPFGDQVRADPFNFDRPEALAESLRGADTLYNTYWVRFSHGRVTFDAAVRNTRVLFDAAARAGVRRIVHVSISNPSLDSPLPYFRGKALLEQSLRESGPSYAILRPTVIFGREDILINNIAWILRRMPVFGIPGDGRYRLQPVYVEDMADLAVQAGHGDGDVVLAAVGPEVFTFEELVRLVARVAGSRARLIHVPPAAALLASRALGWLTRDVVLTRDELAGLMENLLVSADPPTGPTRLSSWAATNASGLGARYASELARHYVDRGGTTAGQGPTAPAAP